MMIMNTPYKKLISIIFSLIIIVFCCAALAFADDVSAQAQIRKIPDVFGAPTTYTAQKNTAVFDIARKNSIALDHILMANMTGSTYIKAGKSVIIPTFWIAPEVMEKGLILNLPERAIYVYKDWKVISVYPVAVGALGWNTPTGNYKISAKTKNPTWFPPAWANIGHPVMPGPHNPLGDRWMGIMGGYGIHATNAPTSIGDIASHGCIRMYPENARALFEQVYVGMPLKITYESIKVGFNPADGKFYVSVFPDVYGYGTNSSYEVNKKLSAYGLDKFVDEKHLAKLLKEKRGMPQVLIDSNYAVTIDKEPVTLALKPIVKDNAVFVDIELFRMLGFDVSCDGKSKTLNITQGLDNLRAAINNNSASFNGQQIALKIPPKQAGEFTIVPMDLLSQFGYTTDKFDKTDESAAIVPTIAITKNPLPNIILGMQKAAYEIFASQNAPANFLFKKKQ